MNVALVVEKASFLQRFVQISSPQFEVVVSSMPLTGYALYCIREWIDESLAEENRDDFRSECFRFGFLFSHKSKFLETVVVKTDVPTDSISVMAVRAIGDHEFGELFFRGMKSQG